jgi:hypothetical protein
MLRQEDRRNVLVDDEKTKRHPSEVALHQVCVDPPLDASLSDVGSPRKRGSFNVGFVIVLSIGDVQWGSCHGCMVRY